MPGMWWATWSATRRATTVNKLLPHNSKLWQQALGERAPAQAALVEGRHGSASFSSDDPALAHARFRPAPHSILSCKVDHIRGLSVIPAAPELPASKDVKIDPESLGCENPWGKFAAQDGRRSVTGQQVFACVRALSCLTMWKCFCPCFIRRRMKPAQSAFFDRALHKIEEACFATPLGTSKIYTLALDCETLFDDSDPATITNSSTSI